MPLIVQLFITCIVDTFYPEIGQAVVSVLERAGAQVAVPKNQTCCGQPAFNAGMRAQAREMAIQTIRVFEAAPGPVVVPSGSCAAMIRHNYPELFAGDETWLPRAKALAERTYELTEYLVDVLSVTDVGARFHGPLTYHSSCHLLRELGVDRQPKALLGAVLEENEPQPEKYNPIQTIPLPHADECCGFGGVFSVEHPHISAAMLELKIANIESTGAPTVVVCDAGCLMHINGGLHRGGKKPHVMHIAEILANR
jgi:L-lactate dehydrogenase complex protein LldE